MSDCNKSTPPFCLIIITDNTKIVKNVITLIITLLKKNLKLSMKQSKLRKLYYFLPPPVIVMKKNSRNQFCTDRQSVVDELIGEVKVSHEESDSEEGALEVGLVLGEAGVADRRQVQLLVLCDGAVVVLKAVPDQLEVLCDVVYDRAEARKATRHH
jgi:hypothetical protein